MTEAYLKAQLITEFSAATKKEIQRIKDLEKKVKSLIYFTPDEIDLLLPQLKASHRMDKDDPDYAPVNAAKNWRSMIKKVKAAKTK